MSSPQAQGVFGGVSQVIIDCHNVRSRGAFAGDDIIVIYVDKLQYVRCVGGGFGDSLPADVIERFDVRIGWVIRVALQPEGFAVVRAVSTS